MNDELPFETGLPLDLPDWQEHKPVTQEELILKKREEKKLARQEKWRQKRKTKQKAHISIGRIKNGTSVGLNKKQTPSWLMKHFSDLNRNHTFPGCTHGLKRGESHASGICSDLVMFVKKLYEHGLDHLKILQADEVVNLKILMDALYHKFMLTGELDPEYNKLMRNWVTLTTKMRSQDEGLKINQEINVGVDEFRNIVEEQSKAAKKEILIIDGKEPTDGR